MKTLIRVVVLIVLVAALAAGYLQWLERQRALPTPPPVAETPAMPGEPPAPSGPRYPIPVPSAPPATEAAPPSAEVPPTPESAPLEAEPPAEPLPTLNESTTVMTQILSGMFGEDVLAALFNSEELIRRFVVTVDNLSARKLPRQNLLFKRVAGPFQVSGEIEHRVISADNAARYAPYVQLAKRVETRRLVNVYVRFYPLFQEAYAELGNPNAYFNDRLIEVIDHLLAAPAVAEPIPVVQPKVFYLYADPELEALSAGQKILLRMGSANAAQIKAKLRELRVALTNEAPPRGAAGDAAEQATVPAAPALKVE